MLKSADPVSTCLTPLNNIRKHAEELKLNENRTPENTVLFEGISSVSALIGAERKGAARRKIIRVLIEKSKFETEFRRVSFIAAASRELGFEISAIGPDEAASTAEGKTHGGFFAEATPAVYPGASLLSPAPTGYSVLIEGAEDPYTLAHSMRSLYLCGANELILPRPLPEGADALIARASAGTSELLPVYVCSAAEAAAVYRSRGYRIAAASARDALDCDRADIPFPLLLVAGGEKRGITGKTAKLCDFSLKIPYSRDALCSLPTESAVAVLAYELSRRLRKAGN